VITIPPSLRYGQPGGKQQTANIRNVGHRDASYQQ